MPNREDQQLDQFEAHFTVRSGSPSDLILARSVAADLRMKFTEIELSRGLHALQPMLSCELRGTLDSARSKVDAIVLRLSSAGLSVSRAKLEAPPWNNCVPRSASVADREPADRYFEHHVKVLLPDARESVERLTAAVSGHHAQVSRNARRWRDDSQHERFVTQRCHKACDRTSLAAFEQLLQKLRDGEYPILEAEREYVVFDSDVSLDAGWFQEAHAAQHPQSPRIETEAVPSGSG